MARGSFTLRFAALLAVGALVVHDLRYLAGYGEAAEVALRAQNHAYLPFAAALMLSHDRALAMFDRPGVAVRSQYWMLAVMVTFTSLALWLLAQANA